MVKKKGIPTLLQSLKSDFYCLCVQTAGNKVEKVYSETVPVNSASELRKRPPSLYASSKGNVMQKAKVECFY